MLIKDVDESILAKNSKKWLINSFVKLLLSESNENDNELLKHIGIYYKLKL